jgi:hypothetical protein
MEARRPFGPAGAAATDAGAADDEGARALQAAPSAFASFSFERWGSCTGLPNAAQDGAGAGSDAMAPAATAHGFASAAAALADAAAAAAAAAAADDEEDAADDGSGVGHGGGPNAVLSAGVARRAMGGSTPPALGPPLAAPPGAHPAASGAAAAAAGAAPALLAGVGPGGEAPLFIQTSPLTPNVSPASCTYWRVVCWEL